MNIESIIGITSGIIGIVGGVYGGYYWLEKRLQKPPMSALFDQLTDKKKSDIERREILKKLNGYPQVNNRIKESYIQNFALEKRGREAVLFDICDNNDMEPTDDLCKELIGAFMPSLQKKYQEKRQVVKEEATSEGIAPISMNVSKEKAVQLSTEQTVYLSALLKTKYPDTCERLIQILEKHHIKYGFLEGTKDIWCRDYMPVQTKSGKLIQFKYEPSYLRKDNEWDESRSDVKEICRLNNIDAEPSDINLDGGNVLICDDRAIISDRVFSENKDWNREKLVEELGRLLECEIIIIPAENDDMTGHADGMVRFVNRNTILGNQLADEYKYWREGMQKVLEQYGLTYIDVPFFMPKDPKHPLSAVGVYVNYLEVNNLIVLPVFGRDEDEQVISIIKGIFPDRIIETIDYNEVAKEGGLLNCTTWVMSKRIEVSD
jgi:agmatine/peptidylarginine deiminase